MRLLGELEPGLPLVVVAMEEEAAHLETDLPVLIAGWGRCARPSP